MRGTWYTLARDVWQGAKWVWTAIVIVTLVSVASSVFAGKLATTADAVIIWLRTPGFYQILIFSFIGLYIVVSLASGLTTFILGKNYGPAYAPPPEVQAILDYIKQDMEATRQREEVVRASRPAFTQYLRSIEEMRETISLFAIARAILGDDDKALINKTYYVQAGISQQEVENANAQPFDLTVSNPAKALLFDVLVHESENIELSTEWHKRLHYDPTNKEPQLVEFPFQVIEPGPSFLVIDFYQERRWLRTVRLAFDAIENPVVIASEV